MDEMRHGHFSLMDCLDDIEDPRAASNGTLYDFREVLVIAICASLCDMDTCEDFAFWAEARLSWLKRFLTLKNGTPSSATFYRLFRALDPKQFEAFFRRWVSQIVPAATPPGQIAVASRKGWPSARPCASASGDKDTSTCAPFLSPTTAKGAGKASPRRRCTRSAASRGNQIERMRFPAMLSGHAFQMFPLCSPHATPAAPCRVPHHGR